VEFYVDTKLKDREVLQQLLNLSGSPSENVPALTKVDKIIK
jgi:hypothetical protein